MAAHAVKSSVARSARTSSLAAPIMLCEGHQVRGARERGRGGRRGLPRAPPSARALWRPAAPARPGAAATLDRPAAPAPLSPGPLALAGDASGSCLF